MAVTLKGLALLIFGLLHDTLKKSHLFVTSVRGLMSRKGKGGFTDLQIKEKLSQVIVIQFLIVFMLLFIVLIYFNIFQMSEIMPVGFTDHSSVDNNNNNNNNIIIIIIIIKAASSIYQLSLMQTITPHLLSP